MTPPVAPRPDRPLEPTAAAETTSTQLFGVLYITLTGLVDSMVPNSGPWSLLRQYISYIIKLAPILWWALLASSAAPHPKLPNASTYDWIPDKNNPQAVGPVKATLAAMKLPPAHKNYVLAALPGGGKSPLPKKESNVMAIVFPGVAWPKRRHLGKPSPKPHLLAAIIDLNLTINCK
ncbi:hypothetical protein DSO57_1004612 [Entomophthora muscae]|uniref:Uncharacterized protein n=1 Tax=Entomophthora muscae TaxID=34485 RepID=A0ACC2TV72_9FUNG|nr:hypothetical protein DSO57_1004612 [Entomophthora muscae]